MKISIIGANSYIARNMIHLYCNKSEHDVFLFDYVTSHIDNDKRYRQIDVFSQKEMEIAVQDSDLIYFFTGKLGTLQGFDEAVAFLEINEKAMLSLLSACRNTAAHAKIIFPSTRLVYKGDDLPLKEDAEKEFLTPYAINKYACESYLKMYNNLFGINYAVARICVPYGTFVHPVSSYGTIEFFLKQAREKKEIRIYGDGGQKRTFTYIGDLCRALWQIGLSKECVNDIYNIGGEVSTLRQAAEKIAAIYQANVAEIPWPEGALKIESGSTVFNSQKLDDLIGMEYQTSMDKWLKGI